MKVGTLLITGCGGDIPIALARIARQEGLCERLVGTDIHGEHPGRAFFDDCLILPKATDPNYFDALATTLNRQKAEALVVGSEPELRAFYQAGIDGVWERMPVIMANRKALQVGLDKLSTADWLRTNGLSAPWTVIASESLPASYPCILKARQDSGSRSIKVVGSQSEAHKLQKTHPDHVFQDLLLPDDQEYTCGLYRTADGETRTLVFRRWLQGGFTGRGEVTSNQEIDRLLQSIALGLDLKGSINVQLRLTEHGPVVFEINPRFSSTVMFRHKLGFQDFVWSLQEAFGKSPTPYSSPASGTKIYRVSEEVIQPPTRL